MNKHLSVFPLALILSLLLPAAAMAEERNIDNFTAIHVGGGIDLVLRQGRSYSVDVDSKDEEDIITEVRNNTLTIRKDRSFSLFFNWWSWSEDTVYITLPELVALHASGGSDVDVEGEFSGDKLDVRISGGSDLSMEVDYDRIELTASGGSDASLSGKAREVQFTASGGSDVSAFRLEAQQARLTASGGSDIGITVREQLTARASGGSDITYRGDPQVKDINSSGGSDVSRR